MKKIAFISIFIFASYFNFAQDVIVTISGEIGSEITSFDSIYVENLTNETSSMFNNLPVYESYQINLSQNSFWGTVNTDYFEAVPAFTVSKNTPGLLTVAYNKSSQTNVWLKVYNINGQTVYSSQRIILNRRNSIEVQLNQTGIFLVKVESDFGMHTFKAVGFDNAKKYRIDILDETNSISTIKSTKSYSGDDFSFAPGDSIRILPFKYGYHIVPDTFIINSIDLNLLFKLISLFISITDSRDGKIYKTMTINGKVWMAENLAYLPEVSPPDVESITDPYYYVAGYDGTNADTAKTSDLYYTYGVLYNWAAAKISCPNGWHLPSDDEWKQLEMAIGMSQDEADTSDWRGANEGMKLKSTSGWYSNGNGTDDYGFSGLPGGYRFYYGYFSSIYSYAEWWSATGKESHLAWHRGLSFDNNGIFRNFNYRVYGFSVRCVKE